MALAMAAIAAALSTIALILYLLFFWRPSPPAPSAGEVAGMESESQNLVGTWKFKRGRRFGDSYMRPALPPESWAETLVVAAETLRFAFDETIGKWGFGDLVFGILYHMRRQGNLEVASVFAKEDFVELKGKVTLTELRRLHRLLLLCTHFSKKNHQDFLQLFGISEEDVIVKGNKGKFLKPTFTILRDKNSKSFLLLIPGAHSVKDKFASATGSLVPFHHVVLHEGRVSNLIMGYAHCGMVAAARWIAKCAIPCFLSELQKYPDYRVEIVGHSMGAGIAALLTYMLHEREELSSSTCVAIGPAACMTWELAESGKDFVTAIVNATDLVPTFSAVSVNNLRVEISTSSWLKKQLLDVSFISGMCQIADTMKSFLPSISIERPNLKGASKFFRPLTCTSKVLIHNHAQNTQKTAYNGCSVSSVSFITRRLAWISPDEDGRCSSEAVGNNLGIKEKCVKMTSDTFRNGYKVPEVDEIHDSMVLHINGFTKVAYVEEMDVAGLLFDQEKENCMLDKEVQTINYGTFLEPKAENGVQKEVVGNKQLISGTEEADQLYPPGRIMHMVAIPALEMEAGNPVVETIRDRKIGVYEVPRHMYSKIRLSQTMIDDHYMPRYIKMMELLIDKLQQDEYGCTSLV